MAAATGNRDYARQEGELVHYSGASGYTYYKGVLLMKDGTGSAAIRPLTRAGSSMGYFIGVANNNVSLAAGLGASNEILEVWKRGEFVFEANGTGTSAHIGMQAYALDDQTVGVSIGIPALYVGEITGIPTTSTYRVLIDPAINGRGVSFFPNNA